MATSNEVNFVCPCLTLYFIVSHYGFLCSGCQDKVLMSAGVASRSGFIQGPGSRALLKEGVPFMRETAREKCRYFVALRVCDLWMVGELDSKTGFNLEAASEGAGN